MKPRFNPFFRSASLAASVFITFGQFAHAADLYWDVAPGTNVWGTNTNWSTTSGADTPNPGVAPVGGDRAIFNVNSSQLVISAARTAGNGGDILFDTGAGAYTIGAGAVNSETFVMSTGKNFTMNSGVANDQLFNILLHTGGTSGTNGSYTFNNNSTTNSMTFAGTITAPGSGDRVVAFGGAGLININGAITKGSATNYSITKTGAGSLKINSTAAINSANSSAVTGSITGGGTLDINGGTVRFNGGTALTVGDNTTAGSVIVRAGSTLQLTGAIAIGQGTSGVANTPVSSFTQIGGTTTIGSSSILYLGNYRGATMDIQGGSLTSSSSAIIGIRGNSSMTISGVNTAVSFTQIDLGLAAGSLLPTADLNLNGGTLSLGANGIRMGATSGTKTVSFDGGTLRSSASSSDFVNADFVYVKAGGATIDTNAFDVTIDNALRQFGVTTGALSKISAGTLRLTGTNSYTGGSSVSAGILQFANTASLPSSGAYAATAAGTLAVNAGGVGEFSNATSGAGSIGGFFSGASFASGTAFGIDTTNAGGSLSYAGNFNGSGIGITKLGTGTLTLSGNNGYTGPTTISAGTLQAGSATAFAGGGALVMANAAATFDLNGNNISFTNLTTGSASNTITTTAAGSGTDTLTLSALSAASGALFTDNGTRRLALTVTATANNNTILTNVNNTFSGGLTITGPSTTARLIPVAGSSYTGAAGALTSGPFGTGAITIGTSATDRGQIYFSGANTEIRNNLIVNTDLGTDQPAAIRVDTTGNIISGQINANLAVARFNARSGNGAISVTGRITGTQGISVVTNAGGGSANTLSVTLNNALANNDYAGNTTISTATSTLRLGAANQIPNGASTGNVALTSGTLDLNGFNETINGLTGAGILDNVTATGGASNTLTIGDNNATGNNFTGTIRNTAGSLSVVKIGSGSQSLQTGTNTFSGGLTIRNGSIIALNSTVLGGAGGNSGSITLGHTAGNDSASLLIQGTNLTILNPVTLATNASVGALTIGATSLAGGATAFGGGVSGTNNLTLANGSANQLTFQTAAINNAGTVTNAGAGAGTTSIAIGFGSNVTDIIQNSTTSTLSIANGVASTNTGSTYIKAGTLRLLGPGGGTAITPVNNGTIYLGDTVGSSAATLALGNTNNLANTIVVQSNSNASTKAINVSDSGVPVYSGGITLNDNLDITTSSSAGLTIQTGDVTINNNSTLAFKPSATNAGTFTLSSKITGAGGKVEFAGTTSASPTYIITAANDYTGTTTISKGTLRIGNNTTTGSLSPSSAITNNAAMVFNRTNATVQGTDFANNITGTGSVTLGSGGTYTFTANAFQGGMTLSGASATQLNINAATALGTGTFTISGGDNAKIDNTTGSLVTLNNNLQTWSNNFQFVGSNDLNMGAGAVSMGGTRTLTVTAKTLTVGGAISGSGFGITKRGAGTLILSGATTSDYTGTVTLGVTNGTDGILVLGKDSALGTSAGGLVITGGTQTGGVQLTGGITISDAITFEGRQTSTQGDFISNLSGNNIVAGLMTGGVQGGNYNIGSQAGLIDFQGGITTTQAGRQINLRGAGDGKISGAIANSGTGTIGIRLQGSGIWELSAANTHVGNTSIAGAGTLKLTNNLALQNSALDTVYAGGGTVDFTSVNTPTIGGLTNSGNLAMASNVTSLTLNVAGTQTHTGNLSGGTGMQLFKTGVGTQVLGGTNSYTGLTTVTAGSLQINSAGAIGGSAITMSGSNNSALVMADALTAGSGKTLTISGSGVGGFFGALTNVTGATGTSEWQGDVVIGTSASRIGAQGGTLKVSGDITSAASHQLVIRNSNGGKTILSGTNTYTGETLINASGGELQVEGGAAIHDSGLVNIANSAGNIFRVSGSETIGALTGGGANGKVAIEASQTLTLSSGTQNFAGVIEGSGALTVDGAAQTLSAANTYTGATTINGGTLALDASGSIDNTSGVALGSGTFDVSAKGVGGYTVNNLTGSGNVVGGLTVSTTLAIGNSPGEVSFDGDLTLGTTSIAANFDYEFTGGATPADLGIVSGDLTLDSKAFLNLFQLGTYTLGDTFTLFAYEGTLSGTFIGLAEGDTLFDDESNLWRINYAETTVGQNYSGQIGQTYVNITAIPEPNVAALLGALGTLILLRRRRS
jgi:autotransporter-associated beta strand protein